MKKLFFIFLTAFICTPKMFAGNVTADFASANQLYAEGRFSAAANLYGTILQTGAQSPALLFNCGNAEFKTGNLGAAVAAFHRAELLTPRDSEIRANLNFVRNQVQGATVRDSFWQGWFGQLTLNEWTLLTVISFWLTFILLAARQLRPALIPKLKTATTALAVLTIFSGIILAVQATQHFSAATAVVISTQATARSGPFDDAQTAFIARDGAELSVLSQHDNWVQVADGSGKIGWLNKNQVTVLPAA